MDKRSTAVRQGRGTGWWWTWGASALGGASLAAGPFFIGHGQRLADVASNAQAVPGQPPIGPGPEVGYFVAFGIVLILVGIALTTVNQVAANRRENRRAAGLTGYNDALSDLHKALADLLRSDRGPDSRATFFKAVVRSASSLFPRGGVRVCVYELDATEGEDPSSEPETYLKLVDYGGRADQPRKEFLASTAHGAAAIRTAQGRTPVCVHDSANTEHEVQRERGSAWRAFVAVPLSSNGRPLGLLSFDTRQVTSFTDEHVAIARTVAFFLVLGMQEIVDAANSTAPDVRVAQRSIRSLSEATVRLRLKEDQ